MITVSITENYGGFEIEGSFAELDRLYDDLGETVGFEEAEDENLEYQRLQVLGLMYEIRHTYQGDRIVKMAGSLKANTSVDFCELEDERYRYAFRYPLLFTLIDVLIIRHLAPQQLGRSHPSNRRRSSSRKREERVETFCSQIISQVEDILTPIRRSKFRRYLSGTTGDFPCEHRFLLEKHTGSYLRKSKTRREAILLPLLYDLLYYNLSEEYFMIQADVRRVAARYRTSVNYLEMDARIPLPDEIDW